ncbi:MAG: hypothetical protein AB1626_05210, partial [Candidatus Micrarchaeota archaeon]
MPGIVCDSSTLISLSDTCNIECLYFLRSSSSASFLIPPSVYNEIITCPLHIPRFEFSAIRLRKALEDGAFHEVTAPQIEQRTREVMEAANNSFRLDGKPLSLLHEGEAQCLAAYTAAGATALAIDEKTTRLLIEDPHKLLQALKEEYRGHLSVDERSLGRFAEKTRGVQIIRSAEIIAAAAPKG